MSLCHMSEFLLDSSIDMNCCVKRHAQLQVLELALQNGWNNSQSYQQFMILLSSHHYQHPTDFFPQCYGWLENIYIVYWSLNFLFWEIPVYTFVQFPIELLSFSYWLVWFVLFYFKNKLWIFIIGGYKCLKYLCSFNSSFNFLYNVLCCA